MADQGDGRDAVRELVLRLQSPVSDQRELLSLLCAPLDALGLLPPAFRRYNTYPLPASSPSTFSVHRHFPLIQAATVQHVVPVWEHQLKEENLDQIVHQMFCPDSFSSYSQAAADVALCALGTLLSVPLQAFSVTVLVELTRLYPIDRLHTSIYGKQSAIPSHRRTLVWEDCIRNIASIPVKVANFLGESNNIVDIPPELISGDFYMNLCIRTELLVASTDTTVADYLSSIASLLVKLINLGLFPTYTHAYPSSTQLSFFGNSLPSIRSRLSRASIFSPWPELIGTLSSAQLTKVVSSLFSSLAYIPDNEALDASATTRGLIKREGLLLKGILGPLSSPSEDDKWSAISAALVAHNCGVARARMLVCWVAGNVSDTNRPNVQGLEAMLTRILDVWTNPDHVKHSLLGHHQYLSILLLLTLSSLPPPTAPSSSSTSSPYAALHLSAPFVSGVSSYLTHPDPSVRRCGMLVAEVVAHRSGKELSFGGWEDEGEGVSGVEQDGWRGWARGVRELIDRTDWDCSIVPAEPDVVELDFTAQAASESSVHPTKPQPTLTLLKSTDGNDSDDSLTGYSSPSASSSRSPSPTPSELEERERDPTLNVGKKPIRRPVYLADLVQQLRTAANAKAGEGDAEYAAETLRVALEVGTGLIRRKREYGTELEENAVELAYVLVGLQNNFELEGFEENRQTMLNALVACCPQKAAPAIIEEFFKNQYSMTQRFSILTALAIGARELAGLPIPSEPTQASPVRTNFPSKMLPPAMHAKHLTDADVPRSSTQVRKMLDDFSRQAIEKGTDDAESKMPPQLVRERHLRVQPASTRITDLSRPTTSPTPMPSRPTFSLLAAEYFLAPLISRFWLLLRDSNTRSLRTAHRPSGAYRGSGTGLILSPLVLSQFLGSLAVLLHAARHAPAFLSVLAPDGMELALTLGTRPLDPPEGEKREAEAEAGVLAAALEVCLVVLDACMDLDEGRALGLEHPALLLGAEEWAGRVLSELEKGAKVPGGGGLQEVKLRRAAAGVVLKADEIMGKWRRAMVTM